MSNQNPYKLLNRKPRARDKADRDAELIEWRKMGLIDETNVPMDLSKTPVEELSEDDKFLDGIFGKKKKK